MCKSGLFQNIDWHFFRSADIIENRPSIELEKNIIHIIFIFQTNLADYWNKFIELFQLFDYWCILSLGPKNSNLTKK